MNQDIYVVIEHLRGQAADISYIMLGGARALAQKTGGEVVAVLLGHNVQSLVNNMSADKVLVVDHPALAEFTSDAYQKTLAGLIAEKEPRAVLFASSSIGADLSGVLSARLNLPLISSCQRFSADGRPISQICGGKIMVESDLPEVTTLLTMIPGGYKPEEGQSGKTPEIIKMDAPALDDLRVTLKQYIEAEAGDVDISKEPILVSVGRGIQTQDNLELAEELAKALGGVVSASRPVVDQGWMPTSRLVGKSGKTVKPKVYLTLGISGAPEHAEAIMGSEMIIAINTDPAAPIFDIARYGAVIDMFDLFEVLIAKVKETQGIR
ncbi:MAG: electron transfer flavoprotein subunit alpha/FixB family protein [Chloroflexi bacterium]|nr:electron transfer flavoprotein subunit alpha/FixB family protein [Chloroflexota bacterium]